MRCFIAIDMHTPEVLECLEELSRLKASLRIVAPENLHLTLRFLGEVGENLTRSIAAAMQEAFREFEPFEASLKGVGVFPSVRNMRVLWIGVERNRERLIEMQRSLEGELQKLGFQRDRRFHPHLTVARVKRRGDAGLRDFVARHGNTDYGSVEVGEVQLKRSVLTPRGPVYTTLATCEL
jgi:2'-5' RNA ligase